MEVDVNIPAWKPASRLRMWRGGGGCFCAHWCVVTLVCPEISHSHTSLEWVQQNEKPKRLPSRAWRYNSGYIVPPGRDLYSEGLAKLDVGKY